MNHPRVLGRTSEVVVVDFRQRSNMSDREAMQLLSKEYAWRRRR